MLIFFFELPLQIYQIAHPFWLFDFCVKMVGRWCYENLAIIVALMAQLLQLYRFSSLFPALLRVSYLSLLDMVDHE